MNETADGYTDEQRIKLVKDYCTIKYDRSNPADKDLRQAIAFALRVLKNDDITLAELYCHFIHKGEYKRPDEFYEWVSAVDLEEQDQLAVQARVEMDGVVDE